MFTYRWLLLDCKREFPFKDIFRVFETLWASLPVDRFESNNDNPEQSESNIINRNPTFAETSSHLDLTDDIYDDDQQKIHHSDRLYLLRKKSKIKIIIIS